MNMKWYEDKDKLREAIDFIMDYSSCFDFGAYVCDKTPCFDYKKTDKDIPFDLKNSVEKYIDGLTKEEYRTLNRHFSLLLGERFFVRRSSVVKILARILVNGNPTESKELFATALQIQIKQRMDLLAKTKAC